MNCIWIIKINIWEIRFSIILNWCSRPKHNAFLQLSILVERGRDNRNLRMFTSVSRKEVIIKDRLPNAYTKTTQSFPSSIYSYISTNLVFPSQRWTYIASKVELFCRSTSRSIPSRRMSDLHSRKQLASRQRRSAQMSTALELGCLAFFLPFLNEWSSTATVLANQMILWISTNLNSY
jgi:hypothetical protein